VKEKDIMPTIQKREERFVRLPPDLYAQLVDMAEHEDRSIASAIRTIVREGLAHRKAAAAVRNSFKPREAAHV
jgi:hypothetical protein